MSPHPSSPPGIPTWDRVVEAKDFLGRHLAPTAMVEVSSVDPRVHGSVYLKLESELPTRSFKVRGALYALWSRLRDHRLSEVVAASTGNHGLATAYAGRELSVPVRIYVPESSNPAKCEGIRALGATLSEVGRDITAAREAADEYASRTGAFVLDDATDPNLPAGPATIALEILDQLPDVFRLVVPVGDTALIRGVAAAVKHLQPDARVIGVQAEAAPAYALSWRSGVPVSTDTCDTIADGLATRTTEPGNVSAIRAVVDEFVLVSEKELFDAVLELRRDEGVVAEPAGAAAFAAFRKLKAVSGPTALLVTGGNISPELEAEVTESLRG